jgi:putative nucleotidyltransferase with HDIG domain
MQRDEALSLVNQHLKNRNLVKHCLAVEACMRAMAERLGEDVEKWGLAGVLHDLDYEVTEKSPERHTQETLKILESYELDPDIIRAIQAHAGIIPCEKPMEWVIFAVDPLTGLIIAATLMHPDRKLMGVDLGFVQRRYQEKSFARGARREDIEQIRNIEGMELDEFIGICIGAMQGIRKDLGL